MLKESPLLIFCMNFDNYFTVPILPEGARRRAYVEKGLSPLTENLSSEGFNGIRVAHLCFSVFVQVDYLIAYDVIVSFLYFLALCINLVFLY